MVPFLLIVVLLVCLAKPRLSRNHLDGFQASFKRVAGLLTQVVLDQCGGDPRERRRKALDKLADLAESVVELEGSVGQLLPTGSSLNWFWRWR